MLQLLSGKSGMIFGIICIVIGLVFLFGFDWIKDAVEGPNAVRRSFILSLLIDNLGHYGSSAFFLGGGLLTGLLGWISRKNKN